MNNTIDNVLRTVYFREYERYSLADIKKKFSNDTEKMLASLLKNGIVKQVKSSAEEQDLSELAEEDFALGPIEETTDKFYVFCFVGILLVNGYILKCLPKYYDFPKEYTGEDCKIADEHLKLVFKVLKKYHRTADEEKIHLYNDSVEGQSFNFLAVMLYLLQDYHENGLYTNEKPVIDTNGTGEILWDRTINNTFAILQNGAPFYMELQTRRRVIDENDYFCRLHQAVLEVCSKTLIDEGLLELFELSPADVVAEALSNFGEKDYICYRIEQELNVQFNTRKKLLLKTIYAFIRNEGGLQADDHFSMFGTNFFHVIWEAVCKKILQDQLSKKINTIALFSGANANGKTFKEFIESPLWQGQENSNDLNGKKTFIPDVVSVVEYHKKWYFSIFDAKYYHVKIVDNQISGQPGIESVSKQFLYEMAYRPLLNGVDITITNSFIFPYKFSGKEICMQNWGKVTMPMFTNPLSGGLNYFYGFSLKPIGIILVEPTYFYQVYLNDGNILKDVLPLAEQVGAFYPSL